MTKKSNRAFRSIREVSEELNEPQHVLRYWEKHFPELNPLQRGGGRRHYRPEDVALLLGVQAMLRHLGYTVRGVRRVLRDSGKGEVKRIGSEYRATPKAPLIARQDASALRATAQHKKALSQDLKDARSMDLQQIVDTLRTAADELRE